MGIAIRNLTQPGDTERQNRQPERA